MRNNWIPYKQPGKDSQAPMMTSVAFASTLSFQALFNMFWLLFLFSCSLDFYFQLLVFFPLQLTLRNDNTRCCFLFLINYAWSICMSADWGWSEIKRAFTFVWVEILVKIFKGFLGQNRTFFVSRNLVIKSFLKFNFWRILWRFTALIENIFESKYLKTNWGF